MGTDEYFKDITYIFKPKDADVNRNIYILCGKIFKVKIKM